MTKMATQYAVRLLRSRIGISKLLVEKFFVLEEYLRRNVQNPHNLIVIIPVHKITHRITVTGNRILYFRYNLLSSITLLRLN